MKPTGRSGKQKDDGMDGPHCAHSCSTSKNKTKKKKKKREKKAEGGVGDGGGGAGVRGGGVDAVVKSSYGNARRSY